MIKIISVVDANPINQIALKILILGLIDTFKKDYEIDVLINGKLPDEYLRWVSGKGVKITLGKIDSSIDRYKSKFLLINHINRLKDDENLLLYLDPDHLVFNKPIFPILKNELVVSSEVGRAKFIYHGKTYKTHNNTSLIYGQAWIWKEVLRDWEKCYYEIQNEIPSRHREEIAFSLSAYTNNISLSLAQESIQSGFYNNKVDTSLFHYGGEYLSGKKIKNHLFNISERDCKYPIQQPDSLNNTERILFKRIDNIVGSEMWR